MTADARGSGGSRAPGGVANLEDLARSVVGRAQPGEQVEVYVGRGRSTQVKVHEGSVESFTSAESMGVGIRVVVGGRQGFAHAGSLDLEIVAETLAEARDNVAFGEVDEAQGVASPDGVAPVPQDLWNEKVVALAPQRKIDIALELERAVLGADPRISGLRTTVFADSVGEAAVATSTGVEGYGRGTSCSVATQPLARDGDETQTGYGVDVARDPDDLDLDRTAAQAAERATRVLGATKPASRRLTIVLEPRLAATLLSLVGGMLTGEVVLKGRSPFSDRLGEQIASPLLTLVDDPTDPRSFGADEIDGEGLACRRNPLFQDGVLQAFLHNSYTARRAGTSSTGSAVRGFRSTPGVGTLALAVEPGARTLDEIVASIDDGLFVHSLTGLHSGVNPVSGDFSVGADGLVIRGGALAEPVREITLASTLQRMLLDISEVGGDLEWLPGGTGAVSLVIPDVSMSGR